MLTAAKWTERAAAQKVLHSRKYVITANRLTNTDSTTCSSTRQRTQGTREAFTTLRFSVQATLDSFLHPKQVSCRAVRQPKQVSCQAVRQPKLVVPHVTLAGNKAKLVTCLMPPLTSPEHRVSRSFMPVFVRTSAEGSRSSQCFRYKLSVHTKRRLCKGVQLPMH